MAPSSDLSPTTTKPLLFPPTYTDIRLSSPNKATSQRRRDGIVAGEQGEREGLQVCKAGHGSWQAASRLPGEGGHKECVRPRTPPSPLESKTANGHAKTSSSDLCCVCCEKKAGVGIKRAGPGRAAFWFSLLTPPGPFPLDRIQTSSNSRFEIMALLQQFLFLSV